VLKTILQRRKGVGRLTGMADTSVVDLNAHLVCSGWSNLDILNGEVLACFPGDCGLCLSQRQRLSEFFRWCRHDWREMFTALASFSIPATLRNCGSTFLRIRTPRPHSLVISCHGKWEMGARQATQFGVDGRQNVQTYLAGNGLKAQLLAEVPMTSMEL
jgi:hypothetical protein